MPHAKAAKGEEIRNPRSEGRKKSEIRNPRSETKFHERLSEGVKCECSAAGSAAEEEGACAIVSGVDAEGLGASITITTGRTI
jgi:hypothetical protein